MDKASGSIAMCGESRRKSGNRLPAQRGTSPAYIAWRWTSPSAKWGSSNTSTVLVPFQPAAHSTYNAQKPKVSVRWQPVDPKYIGALTLRGSYTEAFHAPTLGELTPAGTQDSPSVIDTFITYKSHRI